MAKKLKASGSKPVKLPYSKEIGEELEKAFKKLQKNKKLDFVKIPGAKLRIERIKEKIRETVPSEREHCRYKGYVVIRLNPIPIKVS